MAKTPCLFGVPYPTALPVECKLPGSNETRAVTPGEEGCRHEVDEIGWLLRQIIQSIHIGVQNPSAVVPCLDPNGMIADGDEIDRLVLHRGSEGPAPRNNRRYSGGFFSTDHECGRGSDDELNQEGASAPPTRVHSAVGIRQRVYVNWSIESKISCASTLTKPLKVNAEKNVKASGRKQTPNE